VITVSSDGFVTGSDETGCAFNGNIVIPETKYNVFEVSFDASNCSNVEHNGRFFGLGAYDPDLLELEFAGSSDKVTAVFVGTK